MNSILLNSTSLKWYHNLPNEIRRGSIIRFSFFGFFSESLYKGRPGVLVERGLFFTWIQFYSILPPLKWYHNLPNEFRGGSIIRCSFSWFYSEVLYKGRPGVLVERGLLFTWIQFYSIPFSLKWYHNLPNEFRRGSIIRFSFFWFYSESLYKGRSGVLVERGLFLHEFTSTQFYPLWNGVTTSLVKSAEEDLLLNISIINTFSHVWSDSRTLHQNVTCFSSNVWQNPQSKKLLVTKAVVVKSWFLVRHVLLLFQNAAQKLVSAHAPPRSLVILLCVV